MELVYILCRPALKAGSNRIGMRSGQRSPISFNTCTLFFLLLFLPLSIFASETGDNQIISTNNLPAIYIERKIDRSETLIPKLKMQYEWCAKQKNVARKAYLDKSITWPAMKESLSPEYLLGINALPRPEPDWNKEGVGMVREEEYFHNDKYAHIRYGKKFRISENDGLCRLETYGEYEKQDIDNGEYRYKVTLKNKKVIASLAGKPILKNDLYKYTKVKQSKSPVLIRKQSDAQLKKLAEDHPERLGDMVNRMFSKPGGQTAWPDSGWKPKASKDDAELVKDVFQLKETPGTKIGEPYPRPNYENIVLDQLCDIVESKLTKGRVWYWKKMHHYPTVMERPIILKKEQKIGRKLVIEEATRFEVHKQFNDNIFEPPPGIKITKAGGLKKPKPSVDSATALPLPGIKKQP